MLAHRVKKKLLDFYVFVFIYSKSHLKCYSQPFQKLSFDPDEYFSVYPLIYLQTCTELKISLFIQIH